MASPRNRAAPPNEKESRQKKAYQKSARLKIERASGWGLAKKRNRATLGALNPGGAMAEFKPFENDTQSWSAGAGDGLTLNNGTESIAAYGAVKFGAKDQAGASELLEILSAARLKMAPGPSEPVLRARKTKSGLTIEGDVDLTPSTPASALDEAVAALAAHAAPGP
jgi:hypothetical protein